MIRPLARLWLARKVVPATGDLLIMTGALLLSFAVRQPSLLEWREVLAFLPLFGLWIGTLYAVGLYELRVIRDFEALMAALLLSAVACAALGVTYAYVLQPSLRIDFTPKTHLLITIGVSHVLILLWRRAVLTLFRFTPFDLRVVVLAEDRHKDFLRVPVHETEGVRLVGETDDDVDLVVIDSRWTSHDAERMRAVLTAAFTQRTPIVPLDDFYESLSRKVATLPANDLTCASEHVLSRYGSWYFYMKRAIDVILSMALLAAASPFLVIVAVAIRFGQGVSPLYGQERVGYLGQPFTLYKFQTMRPDADSFGPFAPSGAGGDPRVTPLGRALRRFRLDELPQLWNVLRGDMSLVGPRPEWIKEVEILRSAVPNYYLRHLVPSGLTGWAQVYFRATSDPYGSLEKHQYDLYYLKHFSLALDLSILLKTFGRVIRKDSRVAVSGRPLPASSATHAHMPVDIASLVRDK